MARFNAARAASKIARASNRADRIAEKAEVSSVNSRYFSNPMDASTKTGSLGPKRAMGGASGMSGATNTSVPGVRDGVQRQVFYGAPDGSVMPGEKAADRWVKEQRISQARERHNVSTPERFYAGPKGIVTTEEAAERQAASIPKNIAKADLKPETSTAPSDWLPPEYRQNQLERAQRNIDARAAFKDEEKLAEMDRLQKEAEWKQQARAEDKARRDAETPSNGMDKGQLRNRENEYEYLFREEGDSPLHRADYENYGNRLEWKGSAPEGPYAKPATSAANDPVPGYKGGAGKEQAPAAPDSGQPVLQNAGGTGTNPAKEAKASSEPTVKANEPVGDTSNTPKSGESVQNSDTGYDGGAGKEWFKGQANQKGISNAEKHKFERIGNDFDNYTTKRKYFEEKGDSEALTQLNKEYGVKDGVDPLDHFKSRAGEEATTMDWIMGNHVPQYAAGTALAGGAISACFSNKGKMSNAELYGDNF